jgi:hypothetical protein
MLVLAGLICLAFQVHSQGDNFVTVDPAIGEMEKSLDMPRPSVLAGTEAAAATPISGHSANIPIQNLAGNWHIELTNGANVDLVLSQSGSVIFGHGNVTSGNASLEATANGFLSGNVLRVSVVPIDGKELYSLSLDLSGQAPARTYNLFTANAATLSGTVRKVSYTTGV